MASERELSVQLQTASDIVVLRQEVRRWAVEIGLSLVDQTKIVTAASELARNTIDYGGGGAAHMAIVRTGPRKGIRLTFEDHGPGIADVQQALRDGYSTGSGLGLGLGGSRRLVNEFTIDSMVGRGTTIVITKWR